MTIDELIQRSGGQHIPVEDRVQIKEITKLNKNIQTLIERVDKSADQDKDSSDKLSDKIKKLAENVVKKPAEKIAPARRIVTPKTESKKDDSSARITKIEKSLGDLLKTMTTKGPFAGLQPKQMAGTIDPTKRKLDSREGDGGGSGGGLFSKLLAGALAAYFIKENWDEISKVLAPAFNKLKDVITNAVGENITGMLGDAKDQIEGMVGDLTPGKMLAGAALGYGAYKLGKAGAERAGSAVGRRIAAGLGMGAAADALAADKQKKAEAEAQKKAEAEKKKQEARARKEAARKPMARVEPTLDKPKVEPQSKPTPEKPKIESRVKPQPTPILEKPKVEEPKVEKPMETTEQKEARDKAVRKAQDEQRAKIEADRAKSQKTIDDVSSRRKPSFADKLKEGAKKVGGKLGGVGRVAGAALRKAGPVAALAFGAYDTANAATEAEEVLGIEGRKATVGERIASGVGGLAEGLSFGLVSREKVAQGIVGATNMQQRQVAAAETPRKDVDRQKVVQAIEQKAMDEKKRREINAEISRNKIEMHKLLRDGKKEQAMDLARETVKLQDKLKAADRVQSPGRAVYQQSQENNELKMQAAMTSPYRGMAGMVQNIVNNQNSTNVSAVPIAKPRDIASSIERYLDKVR